MEWIELTGVSKSFGDNEAVKDLNLHIDSGISIIQGKNGAGKSTLVSILEGLTRPDYGTVRINGIDPRENPERIMENVSFIPESPVFFGSQKVREFLNIYTKLNGGSQDLVEYYLTLFGINSIVDSHFKALSKGESQLVQIVASLSSKKQFYVMDEPNSNLDILRRGELSREIQRMGRENGSSFLIITHIMEDVYPISDRVFIMDKGKIISSHNTRGQLEDNLINIIKLRAFNPSMISEFLSELNPEIIGQEVIVKTQSLDKVLSLLPKEQINSIINISSTVELRNEYE